MTGLHPIDRELLYFICSCAHHRVRVVRIKAKRRASLMRLRYAGLVSLEGFQPSQGVFAEWLERHQTPVPRDSEGPAEPPAPEAVAEGGGAARCVAPPPERDDDVLQFFSRDWELLRFPTKRWAAGSVHQLRGIAIRLRERGLLEMQWRDPQSLWRLAQPDSTAAKKSNPARPKAAAEAPRHRAHEREAGSGASLAGPPRLIADSKGASGTARKAPGAAESTAATRIRDRAPIKEPPSVLVPPTAAHPVDIKVNTRRDPTQPPPGYYDQRPGAIVLTDAVIRRAQAEGSPKRKSILKQAAERNAAGLSNGDRSVSVHVRMAQRALADQEEQEARRTDPVEQAKLKLARRHSPVCGAEIMGGPEGKFYVGRKLVSRTELLAMAERLSA